MSAIEQVEKLKEKANVSYEDAKAALEAASGDMLDAMIYLERQGKVQKPQNDGKIVTSPPKDESNQKRRYGDDSDTYFLGAFLRVVLSVEQTFRCFVHADGACHLYNRICCGTLPDILQEAA